MIGSASSPGIMVQTLRDLFEASHKAKGCVCVCLLHIGYLSIYMKVPHMINDADE
jgi:hypothetical protein